MNVPMISKAFQKAHNSSGKSVTNHSGRSRSAGELGRCRERPLWAHLTPCDSVHERLSVILQPLGAGSGEPLSGRAVCVHARVHARVCKKERKIG